LSRYFCLKKRESSNPSTRGRKKGREGGRKKGREGRREGGGKRKKERKSFIFDKWIDKELCI
jgi:hypothetical protein